MSSRTPRTDAAERFFYESGRPPVGFVDSTLARSLELELARALSQLSAHGLELSVQPELVRMAAVPTRRAQRSAWATAVEWAVDTPAPAAAAQVPWLAAVPASDRLGELRHYDDGDALYRAGERAEHVFIVLQGQVRITQRADQGPDRQGGPQQVLAEQGLFEAGVHTESVQAAGPVSCVLMPSAALRASLAAESTVLPSVLMGLVLQYRMCSAIADLLQIARAGMRYEVLGQKTFTGPELHRALVETRAGTAAEPLHVNQMLCLQLQASELLPTQLLRAGQSLGRSGEAHAGPGLMMVHGMAQVQVGQRQVALGQGSVIGVAEALTGQSSFWSHTALEDINVRALPADRALQRLPRADTLVRDLASHLCAATLALQASCLTG